MVPKSSQMVQNGSKLAKNDSKMFSNGLEWFKIGRKWFKNCFKNGFKKAPKCCQMVQNGSKLVKNGSKIDNQNVSKNKNIKMRLFCRNPNTVGQVSEHRKKNKKGFKTSFKSRKSY